MPSFDRVVTVKFRPGTEVAWPLSLETGELVRARSAGRQIAGRKDSATGGMQVNFTKGVSGTATSSDIILDGGVRGFRLQFGDIGATITLLTLNDVAGSGFSSITFRPISRFDNPGAGTPRINLRGIRTSGPSTMNANLPNRTFQGRYAVWYNADSGQFETARAPRVQGVTRQTGGRIIPPARYLHFAEAEGETFREIQYDPATQQYFRASAVTPWYADSPGPYSPAQNRSYTAYAYVEDDGNLPAYWGTSSYTTKFGEYEGFRLVTAPSQRRPGYLAFDFDEPLKADLVVPGRGLKLFASDDLRKTTWARLVESSASENVVEVNGAATIVQQEFATFELRARNDLDVFDALIDERGRTWDITAIEDIPFDRTAMRINCQRDVGA